MEKTIFIILLISLAFFAIPVSATHPCPPPGPIIALCNPLAAHTLEELIEAIIDFIFWVAVALAPLMVLIGAFYFITSGGDPAKIQTAKNIILYTVIGLAIVMLAKGIIGAIKMVLGTS